MSDPVAVPLEEARALVERALCAAGAEPAAAEITARALVDAEAQGLASHGLSRVAQYCMLLANDRCNRNARPRVLVERAATVLVDADDGLAFPACHLALERAMAKARTAGVAVAGVTNSHHFGVAAWHLEAVADAGLVGLAMGNSPAAMPVPGGRRALLGTNPLAACFPRPAHRPLIVDLSLSEVARGKIMVAAREGRPIPPGWALDAQGRPTTDAKAALEGSMLPVGSASGGAKGGMIALTIELLATTLTGAHFGAEADSFFEAKGNRPRLGQFFVVIDPGALAGSAVYAERIEALVAAMLQDDTVRLPGARRDELRARALAGGLRLAPAMIADLQRLAQARQP